MMEGEDEKSSDEAAFGNKSVLVRALTIFGGPLYNFILAFVLSVFVISMSGYDKSFVTEVEPNSPAFEAGLKEGDLIKKFDGKTITFGRDLFNYFHFGKLDEGTTTIVYERNGKEIKTDFTPQKRDVYYLGFSYNTTPNQRLTINALSEGGVLKEAGAEVGDQIRAIDGVEIADGESFKNYIALHPLTDKEIRLSLIKATGLETELKVKPVFGKTTLYSGFSFNTEREKTDFGRAILYSFAETRYSITSTIDGLKMLVTGRVNKEELAGPIGITQIIGDSYEASKKLGVMTILINMAIISIIISANLGVMNLLPIPALDGGRLIFLFVEWVRGKPMDEDREGMIHMIGFGFLMVLMAFLFYNDIMRLFLK